MDVTKPFFEQVPVRTVDLATYSTYITGRNNWDPKMAYSAEAIEQLKENMKPPPTRYDHCGYLGRALEAPARQETVEQAIGLLGHRVFDSIAVCGCSGMLFGSIMAYATRKELILVRKPTDTDNHSRMIVEGHVASRRYIIVDDCVSSGKTVRYMQEQIQKKMPHAWCVGIFCYMYLGREYSMASSAVWQDRYIE